MSIENGAAWWHSYGVIWKMNNYCVVWFKFRNKEYFFTLVLVDSFKHFLWLYVVCKWTKKKRSLQTCVTNHKCHYSQVFKDSVKKTQIKSSNCYGMQTIFNEAQSKIRTQSCTKYVSAHHSHDPTEILSTPERPHCCDALRSVVIITHSLLQSRKIFFQFKLHPPCGSIDYQTEVTN